MSGCSSIAQISDGEQQQILAEAQAPRLQAGEKIRVNVYGEASLSGDYQIDPSGFVSVPLAGNIKAAGLTQNELAEALATSFRSRYLKNPKVTVSVAEFRPFYIIGEIEKPGSYPYTSGPTSCSAIAIAGGTTYRASKSTILIQHRAKMPCGNTRSMPPCRSCRATSSRFHNGIFRKVARSLFKKVARSLFKKVAKSLPPGKAFLLNMSAIYASKRGRTGGRFSGSLGERCV